MSVGMTRKKPAIKTQKETAEKIGTSEGHLCCLFRGHRRVTPEAARKIAAYLGQEDWRRFVHMPGPELRRELMG